MAGSLIILNGSLRLILWAQKDYIVTFDWVLQLMLIQTHNEDDTEEKTIDDDDADKMPGHKSFACFPRGRAGKSFQRRRKSDKNSEVPRGYISKK